jgi:hypothetical protein
MTFSLIAKGAGDWSKEAIVQTTASEPVAPVWMSKASNATSILLSWAQAGKVGIPSVLQYTIQRASLALSNFVFAQGTNDPDTSSLRSGLVWDTMATLNNSETQWIDESVSPSSQFLYRLRAENSIGISGWTEIYAAALSTEPATPNKFSVGSVNQTSARVSWQVSQSNGPRILEYSVEVAKLTKIPLMWERKYSGVAPTAEITGLVGGVAYAARVLVCAQLFVFIHV